MRTVCQKVEYAMAIGRVNIPANVKKETTLAHNSWTVQKKITS